MKQLVIQETQVLGVQARSRGKDRTLGTEFLTKGAHFRMRVFRVQATSSYVVVLVPSSQVGSDCVCLGR